MSPSRVLASARKLAVLAMLTWSMGCGGSSPPRARSGSGETEVLWRSKCGSCHMPIEPGSRARSQVEEALARHRRRVRLTEQQWSAIADFLAPSR